MYSHFEAVCATPDLAIVTIRKVACTSIQTVFKNRLPKPDGRALIAFIRDPIERFMSGYNFFHNTRRWQYFPGPENYEQHVDNVLAGQRNKHWDPQVEILEDLVVTPYRLEDIGQVWNMYGFPELPHKNRAPGDNIRDPDYRAEELREFYAKDIDLRSGLDG